MYTMYLLTTELLRRIGADGYTYKQRKSNCLVDLCCVGHAVQLVDLLQIRGFNARNRGRFVKVYWI